MPPDQLDQQVRSIEPPSVEESSQESCDLHVMPPDHLDPTVVSLDQICTSLEVVARISLQSALTQNKPLTVTFHQVEGNDELVTGLHPTLEIKSCRVETSEKVALLRDLNKTDPHGLYVVNSTNDPRNRLAFTMEMNDFIGYVHFMNKKKAAVNIYFHIIMNCYLVVCI